MKYAIYDKAADGYLTKMEFEMGYSDNTQFECGLNEYITEAKLLDTPKEAADAIARIESFKFMENGRFVMHSFDDELNDQYIISEAGTPTKVVDSITVDLDGTINVKYGTMAHHWSASSLEYAITRMNALQKAKSPKYTAWCNTFDIYKVITVTDERSCNHYQFIKVTEKGLTEYAKDEVLVVGKEITDITEPLNKRIEELEKANYKINKSFAERAVVCAELRVKNTNLTNKVESIKKEASRWKKMYESAVEHREALKNVIDTIYTDLKSASAYCDKSYRLKAALNAFKRDDGLNHISMPTEVYYIQENRVCLTAKDEVCAIIDQILTIMESRALNQSVAFSAAEDIKIAQDIAEKIIPICEADDEFDVTLKKFSELYKAVNTVYDCNNDSILYAFKSVLEIFAALEGQVRNIIDENVVWKNKAMKAVKDLNDQKRLNKVNSDTIDRMVAEKRAMNKELSDAADALKEVNDKNEGLANMLNEITDCVGDIILATRTTDYDKMMSELIAISNKIGVKTSDDGPMFGISVILNAFIRIMKEGNDDIITAKEFKELFSIRNSLAEIIYAMRNATGVRENIKDICAVEKINITNHDLKNGEIAKLSEKIEKLKGLLNSMYGYNIMITGGRCCGKQVMADILSGKKIPINKDKYDSILTSLKLIDLSYEGVYGTNIRILPKPKPTWLPGLLTEFKDLTK